MGLLVNIRESWKTWLLTTNALPGGAPGSGPASYFAGPPAIDVVTEKKGSVEQAINDALASIGLSVLITTVIAKDAQPQMGGLYFDKIIAVARIFEAPDLNQTGVCASDLAEALAWFSNYFTPSGGAMTLRDISLAPNPHPAPLAYDVFYTVAAGINSAPVRPPHS